MPYVPQAPSLLHPERWRDLEPEFEAQKLLQQADDVLSQALDTAPVARVLKMIRDAMRLFHPAVQDPAACEEYEQRKAGTFGASQKPASPSAAKLLTEQSKTIDEQSRVIEGLEARLAKLETASTEPPEGAAAAGTPHHEKKKKEHA